jgi:vacuolar-type H+-ATPase subunit H
MDILDLIDELNDIANTSSRILMSKKIIVDKDDLLEVVQEIHRALPDDIKEANWLQSQRQKILDDAKREYEAIVQDARQQAEIMISQHEIMQHAKERAENLTQATYAHTRQLRLDTYAYLNKILVDFQEKVNEMHVMYFGDMFNNLQKGFEGINATLQKNRNQLEDLSYKTHQESGGAG